MISDTEPIYPIGVVAKMLDVSVDTVRVYEKEGLILTAKMPSGHRRYSANEIEKLRCIRRMITEKGLNIEGIKRLCSMIPCWGINPDCTQEYYEQCDAFKQVSAPCWALEHKSSPCADRDCYHCPVYHTHYDCQNIKSLVHNRDYLKQLFKNVHTPEPSNN